jgi:hypothetical protein
MYQNRIFVYGSISAPLKITLCAVHDGPAAACTLQHHDGRRLSDDDGILQRPSGFCRRAWCRNCGDALRISEPISRRRAKPLIPRNLGMWDPRQFSLNLRLSRTWGFGTTKFAGSSGGARANAGGGPGPRGGGFGGFGGGGRGGPFRRRRDYRASLQCDAIGECPEY